MLQEDRDFDALYRDEPAYVRGNANLPGPFVMDLAQLEYIGERLAGKFEAAEEHYPGFNPESHPHEDDEWCWIEYGFPNGYDPAVEFAKTYLQLSRAEDMKGSEQTTRGFMTAGRAGGIEGAGEKPDLYPRGPLEGQTPTIIIQSGIKDMKKEARRHTWLKRRK